jgi:surface antigen
MSRASLTKISPIVVLVFALAACGETVGPKAVGGTAAGAAAGGLIGAAAGGGTKGIIGGVLLGGLLGGALGDKLDQNDRELAARNAQRSFEYGRTGEATTWRNPDSGHYGTITPTRTYETPQGYCREFQQTIYVDGQQQQGYGTACRQPDGSWKIVDTGQ